MSIRNKAKINKNKVEGYNEHRWFLTALKIEDLRFKDYVQVN